jgi:cell division protein FtsN
MAFEAKSKPKSAGGRTGMNPLVAGIIIGLLMGIFLALGVAMWLNRAATPFIEKTKPSEQLAPMKVAPPAKTDTADANKPRFEFYQTLPGEKNVKDGVAAKAPDAKSTPATPAKELAKEPVKDAAKELSPPPPIKSLNETLYLQAGAYQNESDAEAMKAKIAFAGFEANVKSVNVASKGTLYRVRLGPYKSQDEVNRIKTVLSQNGISAAVVKPE